MYETHEDNFEKPETIKSVLKSKLEKIKTLKYISDFHKEYLQFLTENIKYEDIEPPYLDRSYVVNIKEPEKYFIDFLKSKGVDVEKVEDYMDIPIALKQYDVAGQRVGNGTIEVIRELITRPLSETDERLKFTDSR